MGLQEQLREIGQRFSQWRNRKSVMVSQSTDREQLPNPPFTPGLMADRRLREDLIRRYGRDAVQNHDRA